MGYKAPLTLLEKDFRVAPFLRALLAELIGTSFFIFLSTATVTSGCHTTDVANQSGNGGDTSLTNVVPGSCFLSSTSALLNIALAFGFSLFAVIYFTASFSGGHINPAVTIAFIVSNKVSVIRGACYIVMQLGGAAVASGVLKGLDPTGFKAAAGASNQLNPSTGVTVGEGIGYEIVMSFAFIFVIFAATDATKAKVITMPIMAPFVIGMTLFVSHLIMIPIDGCCLNPARSFGPAVVSRTFHQYWIFWVGPIVGGLVAAAIYGLAFREFNIRKTNRHGEADENGDWNVVSSSPPGVDIEGGKPATA